MKHKFQLECRLLTDDDGQSIYLFSNAKMPDGSSKRRLCISQKTYEDKVTVLTNDRENNEIREKRLETAEEILDFLVEYKEWLEDD
jgi:hypothetical protein